jgi:hypothetical protein
MGAIFFFKKTHVYNKLSAYPRADDHIFTSVKNQEIYYNSQR